MFHRDLFSSTYVSPGWCFLQSVIAHEWISEPECLTLRHAVQLRDILSDLETYSILTNTITTVSLRVFAHVSDSNRTIKSLCETVISEWSWWFNFRSLLATDCLDKIWVSLHANLLRASWQWSYVEYFSRSDIMSRSWTTCLEVGQPVSKLDDLPTSISDKRWESLHALLLRASWQWSGVEYVSRSDSMSQS